MLVFFPTKGLLPPKSCLHLEAEFFSDVGGSTAPKGSSYQNTAAFRSEDKWRTNGEAFAGEQSLEWQLTLCQG